MSWQNYPNIPMADLPLDDFVITFASQDPKYKVIIVKNGLNPVAPANSVEIQRTVDQATTQITVIYGVLTSPENSGTIDYSLQPQNMTQPSIAVKSAIPAINVTNPLEDMQSAINKMDVDTKIHEDKIEAEEEHLEMMFIWVCLLIVFIVIGMSGFLMAKHFGLLPFGLSGRI